MHRLIHLYYRSQNYWCHVALTLYKPDTSLRLTVGAGSDGVCLRESWLYSLQWNCKITGFEIQTTDIQPPLPPPSPIWPHHWTPTLRVSCVDSFWNHINVCYCFIGRVQRSIISSTTYYISRKVAVREFAGPQIWWCFEMSCGIMWSM